MKSRGQVWTIRLALIATVTVFVYAGLFIGRPLLSAVTLRMPENYEYLVDRNLEAGNHDRALQACDRELKRIAYNFHAWRLKAKILESAGRYDEALDLLWGLPGLYQSVRNRTDVPSRGWDAAKTHLQLVQVLWKLERYQEALDELGAALDWHDPQVEPEAREFVTKAREAAKGEVVAWTFVAEVMLDGLNPRESRIRLDRIQEAEVLKGEPPPPRFYARLSDVAVNRQMPGAARDLIEKELAAHGNYLPSMVSYRQFTRQFPPPGTWSGPAVQPKQLHRQIERATVGRVSFGRQTGDRYSASDFSVNIYRNTFVQGTAKIWQKAKGICIVAKGVKCNDVWPILSVRRNGKIIGRRYINSYYYQVYDLPISFETGSDPIEFGFENDEYNPITGQDRNVALSEILFY